MIGGAQRPTGHGARKNPAHRICERRLVINFEGKKNLDGPDALNEGGTLISYGVDICFGSG
jgi:hypothetical protein